MIRNAIQILDLGNNTIRNISNIYGIVFPELRQIILTNNKIKKIIFQAYRYWPSLTEIDLKWNTLRHLELGHSI